jgi:uncharacterized protein (TIGR02271 family)
MDQSGFRPGSRVLCSDGYLGVLMGVEGDPEARLLAVQPDDYEQQLLRVPATYVSGVSEDAVSLNMSCSDAHRLAGHPGAVQAAAGDQGAIRVPLVEEQLVAETNWRQAGVVEIARNVRTEVQELDVPVRYEQALVQRVPVNRVLEDGETAQAREEGDTLIVPIVHEEIVVLKRRVLVEELHVTKQVETRTQHIAEEVRRDDISISHPGLGSRTAQDG